MFEQFFPSEFYESAYVIDYEKLYKDGYRALIYDIDNTLVPHGAPADNRAIALMERLRGIGYDITFLSNNKQARVDMFNEKIGAHTIAKAGKPGMKMYIKAMVDMGCDCRNTLFIGDQIFTDIWGAKKADIRTLLVKPIDTGTDEIQIVLKRKLEKIVLKQYLKEHTVITGE